MRTKELGAKAVASSARTQTINFSPSHQTLPHQQSTFLPLSTLFPGVHSLSEPLLPRISLKQSAALTFTMSDVAETKPDPTTQAPEAATTEKSVTEVAADKAAEVAETAKDAAVKTSDTVFSMFGGGPKKEEKPKADEEENDRSGSAKAQKEEKEEDVEADKVSWYT